MGLLKLALVCTSLIIIVFVCESLAAVLERFDFWE